MLIGIGVGAALLVVSTPVVISNRGCAAAPPAGQTCASGHLYYQTPWNVPYCAGGPFTFHSNIFSYYYVACTGPAGDLLVVNATEPTGARGNVSFDDGLERHAPVVTVLSSDGEFGFVWQVGTPQVTLLVEVP